MGRVVLAAPTGSAHIGLFGGSPPQPTNHLAQFAEISRLPHGLSCANLLIGMRSLGERLSAWGSMQSPLGLEKTVGFSHTGSHTEKFIQRRAN